MIKTLLPTIVLCLTILHLQAQPNIDWQKVIGGSQLDEAFSIQQTSDGGYIVSGETFSTDGDVIGNHGSGDYWVVKLTNNGIVSWKKCYGGSQYDSEPIIQQTVDGGYIIGGTSNSNDGDASGNHGEYDIWIIKLNSTGDLVWQKMYGGGGDEYLGSIQQTTDGGYIIFGGTESNSGNFSGNHGSSDFWLIKINGSGAVLWQKMMGGSGYDEGKYVRQTTDGGYILAGYTSSNDGDISGNHGDSDAWIAKLNSTGNIEWQKCFGGTQDESSFNIHQTVDGGFILSVRALSSDGDFPTNKGSFDAWIVKLNNNGVVEWKKSLGGSNYDSIDYIEQTSDGGYIGAGFSKSTDGDLTGLNKGEFDMWIVKLNSSGTLTWQKTIGGSSVDYAHAIKQTNDGGYIIAGTFNTLNGDIPSGHGDFDFGIVKLGTSTGINELELETVFHIYPNPVRSQLTIESNNNNIKSIEVNDISGRLIQTINPQSSLIKIDCSNYTNGVYFLKMQTKLGQNYSRIITKY